MPSRVIHPSGTEFRGKWPTQTLLAGLFAEFSKPGSTFSLNNMVVEGKAGFIVRNAETADNVCELGVNTYVIDAGKISVQTLEIEVVRKVTVCGDVRA